MRMEKSLKKAGTTDKGKDEGKEKGSNNQWQEL